MTIAEILSLFAYTEWANDRTWSSIERLTDEQFTRTLGGSFPTIRETAAHIVSSEWIWLQRWKGVSPTSAPEWIHEATAAGLRSRLREVESQRAAYLRSLGDADLQTPLAYRRLNGEPNSLPLAHVLQHVVNHSTYHRGQIATMIRQAGGTPVSTDLLNFSAD